MNDALRQAVMDECLKVSGLACSLFDDVEADTITQATAQAIIELNEAVQAIHGALVALVVARR